MNIKRITTWFIANGLIAEASQPDVRQIAFYTGMQLEEMGEKMAAIGMTHFSEHLAKTGHEFKDGLYDNEVQQAVDHPETRMALLDADCDLAWVSIGGGLANTQHVEKALEAVAEANEAKFPGGVVTRDTVSGKVIKPEGWTAPDLSKFL